jgi:hypothetical protein
MTSAEAHPKAIGFFALVAIGIGSMVGAGIFALLGLGGEKIGPASVFSFVIAGLVALLFGIVTMVSITIIFLLRSLMEAQLISVVLFIVFLIDCWATEMFVLRTKRTLKSSNSQSLH